MRRSDLERLYDLLGDFYEVDEAESVRQEVAQVRSAVADAERRKASMISSAPRRRW